MQSVTYEELNARQSLPLDLKIELSEESIRRWYERFDGRVSVSFSGGMDSTVLLHLVRQIYPDVVGICVDALLYPEIKEHVRETENVLIVRPEMSFKQVVEKYGYPAISKRIAQYVREVRNAKGDTATKRLRLTGITSKNIYQPMAMISKKWQFLCNAPFPISDKCCEMLKKQPLDKAHLENGLLPFVGTRAEEASQRAQTYYLYGCNAYDIKRPRSTPLAFWLNQDIWEYIHKFNIKYSTIYNMGYTRTGCFACMFGVHMEEEPNRFQMMRKTHPQLWRACENWGIPDVLDYIGVPYGEPIQPRLFETET